MPTNKPEVVLPELPEPIGHVHSDYEYCAGRPFKNDGWPVSVYDAGQLLAYGQACYEAGRAAQAKHHQQQVGHLPPDAVAWLDMGKGEAQLMFGKRDASNRANKRQLAMLFEKVNPGYHPLYLHPQSADTLTRPADGEFVMVPMEPTGDMLDAMIAPWLRGAGTERECLTAGWKGALSAAPQQSGREVVGTPYRCDYCGADYGARACCDMRYEYLRKFGENILPPISAQQPAEAVAVDAVTPRPMETAPRDGTIVRLLVNFTDNATEDADADTPIWTIGGNTFEGTGEDVWQFAGWNWQQDCFTQGEGTPIAWLPLIGGDTPPLAIDIGKLRELVSEWRNDAKHKVIRVMAKQQLADADQLAALIGDSGEANHVLP